MRDTGRGTESAAKVSTAAMTLSGSTATESDIIPPSTTGSAPAAVTIHTRPVMNIYMRAALNYLSVIGLAVTINFPGCKDTSLQPNNRYATRF